MSEKQVSFKVPGMSCEHCKMAITKAIDQLEGVQSVEIDLGRKLVNVTYEETKINPTELEKAINNAGYEVKNKKL